MEERDTFKRCGGGLRFGGGKTDGPHLGGRETLAAGDPTQPCGAASTCASGRGSAFGSVGPGGGALAGYQHRHNRQRNSRTGAGRDGGRPGRGGGFSESFGPGDPLLAVLRRPETFGPTILRTTCAWQQRRDGLPSRISAAGGLRSGDNFFGTGPGGSARGPVRGLAADTSVRRGVACRIECRLVSTTRCGNGKRSRRFSTQRRRGALGTNVAVLPGRRKEKIQQFAFASGKRLQRPAARSNLGLGFPRSANDFL